MSIQKLYGKHLQSVEDDLWRWTKAVPPFDVVCRNTSGVKGVAQEKVGAGYETKFLCKPVGRLQQIWTIRIFLKEWKASFRKLLRSIISSNHIAHYHNFGIFISKKSRKMKLWRQTQPAEADKPAGIWQPHWRFGRSPFSARSLPSPLEYLYGKPAPSRGSCKIAILPLFSPNTIQWSWVLRRGMLVPSEVLQSYFSFLKY